MKHGQLPPPIRGLERGTWAHHTIVNRLPDIIHRVLEDNEFQSLAANRLEKLIGEIPIGPIRQIKPSDSPDILDWEHYTQPYLGLDWLQPPWFFVEHYFYRRIVEAIGYFQPGLMHQFDPFAFEKHRGLERARGAISDLAGRLSGWLDEGKWTRPTIKRMIYVDLWGNQADLSLWPADEKQKPNHADLKGARAHLLVDATNDVIDHLAKGTSDEGGLIIIVDNAGFELVGDLVLTDYLLSAEVVSRVCLHLKSHPTFVSDATVSDVEKTLDHLLDLDEGPVIELGKRLRAHLEAGNLQLEDDFFWNSPLSMWQMPDRLRRDLSGADLVLSKGDANYRRLLGDRHWPFTTPFERILSYFPTSIAALRTLKAELACGLEEGQARAVAKQDPQWLVNGRWGVIQFSSQDGSEAQS